ncbi:MAG: hypothetical protein ACRD6B_22430 [Bryobacteraceae bacterium]
MEPARIPETLPILPCDCYDGAIMMSRTQITLQTEAHRRARQRASDLGLSLAEYVRQLVARDLSRPERTADPACVFDLGDSGGSDIVRHKHSMIAEAFDSLHKQPATKKRKRA